MDVSKFWLLEKWKKTMICVDCVSPPPLKKLFDTNANIGACKYCQRHGNAMESQKLFEYIFKCVNENIAKRDDLTDYELGMIYECGADFVAVGEIDMVLQEWLGLGDEPYFNDLLEEIPSEFIEDGGYSVHFYDDDGSLEKNIYETHWEKFVNDIKYKYRFFNTKTFEFLDDVFSPLISSGNVLKPDFIRTITRGETLYRARYVHDEKGAEDIINDPASQFGPTPKHLASSQRMTPNGISGLYCALERETCLSEIRSITGDYVVSVALTPHSEIKLLDLTVLHLVEPTILTSLDEGYREALHRQVFLGSLVRKLSRPKARNDELSYLSTQFVFEFLRQNFGQEIIGLIFPSVQTGETGTNVVIFPEHSLIAPSYSPNIIANKDHEATCFKPVKNKVDNPFAMQVQLTIVAESIRFHKITAIKTTAKEYNQIDDCFMSELNRMRLGPPFL